MGINQQTKILSEYEKAHLSYLYSSKQLSNRIERIARHSRRENIDPVKELNEVVPTVFQDHMLRLKAYLKAYYDKNANNPNVYKAIATENLQAAKIACQLGFDIESAKLIEFAREALVNNCLAARARYRTVPSVVSTREFILAMAEVVKAGVDSHPLIVKIQPDFDEAIKDLQKRSGSTNNNNTYTNETQSDSI